MHLNNKIEFLISLMISKTSYRSTFISLFVYFTEIFPDAALIQKPCPHRRHTRNRGNFFCKEQWYVTKNRTLAYLWRLRIGLKVLCSFAHIWDFQMGFIKHSLGNLLSVGHTCDHGMLHNHVWYLISYTFWPPKYNETIHMTMKCLFDL